MPIVKRGKKTTIYCGKKLKGKKATNKKSVSLEKFKFTGLDGTELELPVNEQINDPNTGPYYFYSAMILSRRIHKQFADFPVKAEKIKDMGVCSVLPGYHDPFLLMKHTLWMLGELQSMGKGNLDKAALWITTAAKYCEI